MVTIGFLPMLYLNLWIVDPTCYCVTSLSGDLVLYIDCIPGRWTLTSRIIRFRVFSPIYLSIGIGMPATYWISFSLFLSMRELLKVIEHQSTPELPAIIFFQLFHYILQQVPPAAINPIETARKDYSICIGQKRFIGRLRSLVSMFILRLHFSRQRKP